MPFAARGEIVGAVTLLSTDPSRRYQNDDLVLVAELARRAALTVDRARLYQLAEERSRAATPAAL